VRTYVCLCMYMCVYICMCVYESVYVCVCVIRDHVVLYVKKYLQHRGSNS